MLGSSHYRYLWIRTSIFGLECIAPISFTYCFVLLFRILPSHRLPLVLKCWAVVESLFYIPIYLWQKHYIQRPAIHPSLPSEEERRILFRRCFTQLRDPERYLSKWFFDAPIEIIKRDNVREFVHWAFFNSADVDPIYDSEVEEYVDSIEKAIGRHLEPGRGSAKCLRLTLDTINITHRSLTWYLCIMVVDTITHFSMWFYNFQYYRVSAARSLAVVPPRPLTFLTHHQSPVENLSYWYRPHTARNRIPILFLHGIGVGLYPYVNFLAELNEKRKGKDGDIGIIAIEFLSISSRITQAAPRKEEMCRQIKDILNYHGFDEVVLISHSYGSVVATHLLKSPSLSTHIESVVLIDPVSILLHLPDVAYNFTFRKPRSADEWLLYYFGAKDMGVAHTLGRHFFWTENILWKEDIMRLRSSVFLSERDAIIDTPQVLQYLQQPGVRASGKMKEVEDEEVDDSGKDLGVVMCTELHHGQIFDSRVWRPRLVREVLAHTMMCTRTLGRLGGSDVLISGLG